MARPRKTGLSYFPLDCVLDIKVEELRAEHGNDGFAVWIMILQEVYQTEAGELDCSGVIRRKTLAKRANISLDSWVSIVDTCVEVGLFDRMMWEKSIITSDGIKRRLGKIAEDREKARVRSSSPNNPRKTPEKEKEKEREKETTNTPYSPPRGTPKKSRPISAGDQAKVERIYRHYPRKVGRAKGYQAIRNALDRLTAAGGCVDVVDFLEQRTITYARLTAGADTQFIPHPATWYNDERYFDDERQWERISGSDPRTNTVTQLQRNREKLIADLGLNGDRQASNPASHGDTGTAVDRPGLRVEY